MLEKKIRKILETDKVWEYLGENNNLEPFILEIQALLIEGQINELERFIPQAVEKQMLKYSRTGIDKNELRTWHYESYIKDRLKALGAKKEALRKGSNLGND